MRPIADFFHHFDRGNCAAGHVVRVLDLNQADLRAGVAASRDFLLDLRPSENAVFPAQRAQETAGEHRRHAHFPIEDVRAFFANNLLPRFRVDVDRYLIAHRPARHKQRCFAAEDARCNGFQTIDRRIFAIDVIPNLGFGHRLPHGRCGLRDCVAPQVDHAFRF